VKGDEVIKRRSGDGSKTSTKTSSLVPGGLEEELLVIAIICSTINRYDAAK
jgi:hypothetical protein